MMSDMEVMEAAVARYGSKKAVAAALGVAAQTVSDWGKIRKKGDEEHVVPMPRAHRRLLMILLGLDEKEGGPRPVEGWQDPQWRRGHSHSKACEQIERLFLKTGGRGQAWEIICSLLDWVSPWGDRDWRSLYHRISGNGVEGLG